MDGISFQSLGSIELISNGEVPQVVKDRIVHAVKQLLTEIELDSIPSHNGLLIRFEDPGTSIFAEQIERWSDAFIKRKEAEKPNA